MNLEGINYDTGIPTTHNIFSHETFNPQLVQREIEMIKNDLHSEALDVVAECAKAAKERRGSASQLVFVTGVELSAFMRGFLEGETAMQRLGTVINPLRLLKSTILKGSFHKWLNDFLSQATALIKNLSTRLRTFTKKMIARTSGKEQEGKLAREI
jgi:hypothetical protein